MAQLFKNNAFSTLGATLTNVATTLTVATGHGDRFPVVTAPDFCLITLQDASNNIEVVKVTARTAAADSMTIQRAQDGTTARSWAIGDVVELRLTAFALNPLALLEGASTAAAIRSTLAAAGTGDANTFTAVQYINVNSSSDALKITQAGSGNALYIEDVAADATPFVVSSTGVVGIGTTTPDNVTSAGIALVSNDGFMPQLVNRNKTNDVNASYQVFDKDRAGAIVQNGDVLGNIVFRGYDGATYHQAAAIMASVAGAPGTNDMPGALRFLTTADGASAPTERVRINTSGNVGVGTNSPGSRLEVFGVPFTDGVFDGVIVSDIGSPRLRVGYNTTGVTTGLVPAQILTTTAELQVASRDTAAGAIVFRTGTGIPERFRIDNGGNALVTGSGGLGYGTGSGGTATVSAGSVTLNKPTGRITFTTPSLGAGVSTTFTLNNSTIGGTDTLTCVVGPWSGSSGPEYEAQVVYVNTGVCLVRVTNITGATRSGDAIFVNFAVIKGATS